MLFAFGLTLFAGLATGIGSALALFARTTNTRFLSAALGFSAGVYLDAEPAACAAEARSSATAAGLAVSGSLSGWRR